MSDKPVTPGGPAGGSEPPRGFWIRDLAVGYSTGESLVLVVGGVTIDVPQGRITGFAGESGSGKTTTALSAIGYIPSHARLLGGDALLNGQSILRLDRASLRRLWASKIRFSSGGRGFRSRPQFSW